MTARRMDKVALDVLAFLGCPDREPLRIASKRFGWWDRESWPVGWPSDLPSALHELLGPDEFGEENDWRWYRTPESALKALEAACLAWSEANAKPC